MVFCAAINCSNNSKSSISMFKFPKEQKLRREWLTKMKRKSFQVTKHSRVCADHFTKDCFKQNLLARNSLGSAFKPRRLDLKKGAVPTIFHFKRVESKMGIGQKRSHGNDPDPCPPRSGMSGTTLQGNESVRSAFVKRRKLEVRNFHAVIN